MSEGSISRGGTCQVGMSRENVRIKRNTAAASDYMSHRLFVGPHVGGGGGSTYPR